MNLFDVYTVFPINIIKGKGCYVYDDGGDYFGLSLDTIVDTPNKIR